eukprot:gene16865-20036_t
MGTGWKMKQTSERGFSSETLRVLVKVDKSQGSYWNTGGAEECVGHIEDTVPGPDKRRCGRRHVIWLSVSKDLKWDAERDLDDLGEEARDIPVYPQGSSQLPARGSLRSHGVRQGILFCTYSLLVHGSGKCTTAPTTVPGEEAQGAMDRAALIKRIICPGSRVSQVVSWLKQERAEDPLIILDECHKAKNLLPVGAGKPSQTAMVVVALQAVLPHARIVYSSATGASQPQNLGYMTRLGSFKFDGIMGLLGTLEKAGMGAMEMFALGLKSVGAYACRGLSYTGAEFELSNVELEPEARVMYDRAAEFWQLLFRVFSKASVGGMSTDGVCI